MSPKEAEEWAAHCREVEQVVRGVAHAAEQLPARARRQVPIGQRTIPADVFLEATGTALGTIRRQIEDDFNGKLDQLRREVEVLRTEVDAVRTIRSLATDVEVKVHANNGMIDRLEQRLDMLLAATDPPPCAGCGSRITR